MDVPAEELDLDNVVVEEQVQAKGFRPYPSLTNVETQSAMDLVCRVGIILSLSLR